LCYKQRETDDWDLINGDLATWHVCLQHISALSYFMAVFNYSSFSRTHATINTDLIIRILKRKHPLNSVTLRRAACLIDALYLT